VDDPDLEEVDHLLETPAFQVDGPHRLAECVAQFARTPPDQPLVAVPAAPRPSA